MPLRNTMSDLILLVRDKVADPNADVFTDQQIQDALDAHRHEQRRVPLRPIASYLPGGQALFVDFYASPGAEYWENDYLLQDAGYNTISASLFESATAHWQFASQPNGVSVHITGKTYDIFAASADLLEEQAATVMLQFSFSTGRDTFNRQQKFENILALAQKYREQASAEILIVSSEDDQGWQGDNAVVYPTPGRW